MIKKIICAGLMWSLLQPLAFASLVSARNFEISRLSVCPVQPSLMILESPLATQYMHFLRHQPAFNRHYQLVDRNQFGVLHPACKTLPVSSMEPFIDDIFAMYMMEIDYQPQIKQLGLQLIRTDTGAVIYQKQWQNVSAPEEKLSAITAEWLPVLAKQHSHCLNQFTATVVEDVQMRCKGQLPSLTEYNISSDFRLIFEIVSFDITARDFVQSINGRMTIEPQPARTVQRIALQQQNQSCHVQLASEKILDIQLQPRKLAAIMHLTIPENLSQTWLFKPQIISAEPFFIGDAVEENILSVQGGESCQHVSGRQKEVTQLNYADNNLFKFSMQEMNPFCSASDFIQPVFIRAPNLGTPSQVDITTACTQSALSSSMTFKRRFYR